MHLPFTSIGFDVSRRFQRLCLLGLLGVTMLVAFVGSAWASSSTSVSESVESGDELRAAFQREYAYLLSLRDGLQKQKKEIARKLDDRSESLEAEIKTLQVSLAQASAVTDERLEQASELEMRLRSGGGATAFESALRDARTRVHEMQLRAQARLPERKSPKVSADVDGFESFLKLIDEGLGVASELTSVREIAASFLDERSQPVQASVVLWGGVGAFGKWNQKSYVLAPEGSGRLKIVAEDAKGTAAALQRGQSAPEVGAYIIKSLSERADLSGHLNLAERAAGFMPVIYLLMIALTVAGLFIGLARA